MAKSQKSKNAYSRDSQFTNLYKPTLSKTLKKLIPEKSISSVHEVFGPLTCAPGNNVIILQQSLANRIPITFFSDNEKSDRYASRFVAPVLDVLLNWQLVETLVGY